MRCLAVATVVAMAGCSLRPAGDLGVEELAVPLVVEDPIVNGVPAVMWSTDASRDLAVCALSSTEPGELQLLVYEPAPEVDGDGLARLDLFFGEPHDLLAALEDGDVEARARLGRSRSSVWYVEARESIPALPFVVDGIDTAFEFGATYAFAFDSSDPAARRCGDEAAATCANDCDVVTGQGAAACCADASAAFAACGAMVFTVETTGQAARLRRGL